MRTTTNPSIVCDNYKFSAKHGKLGVLCFKRSQFGINVTTKLWDTYGTVDFISNHSSLTYLRFFFPCVVSGVRFPPPPWDIILSFVHHNHWLPFSWVSSWPVCISGFATLPATYLHMSLTSMENLSLLGTSLALPCYKCLTDSSLIPSHSTSTCVLRLTEGFKASHQPRSSIPALDVLIIIIHNVFFWDNLSVLFYTSGLLFLHLLKSTVFLFY